MAEPVARGPVTSDFDEETPSVARIYDFFLGGANNFEVDRRRAAELLRAFPGQQEACRANRNFLRHAVEHAIEHGIDQFLDLGSGIPAVGNVHDTAQAVVPDARVAYVENEPVAVAYGGMLVADHPSVTMTDADLREPAEVLASPGVADLLDFSRPVALLAVAALHFVPADDRVASILSRYREALAAGSLLALTHSSHDYPDDPEFVADHLELLRGYAGTTNPVYDRSRDELRDVLAAAGFTVNAEGLNCISSWAGSAYRGHPLGAYALISEPL